MGATVPFASILLALALCSGQVLSCELSGRTWSATGISDGTNVVPIQPDTEVTVEFDDDGSTMSGNGGCNNYSGTYTATAPSIEIGENIAITLRFCSPESTMDQESAYIAALSNATAYTVDCSSLEMTDGDGSTMLTFVPLDDLNSNSDSDSELAGTNWDATEIFDGTGLAPLEPNTSVSIEFEEDGVSMSGFAGCNSYNGGYEANDTHVSFSENFAVTMKACSPESIEQQEAAYLATLGNVVLYTVDGDTLELSAGDGSPLVSYVRGADTEEEEGAGVEVDFVGTTWSATEISDGSGLVPVASASGVTAVFADDDTVAGLAGCNQYKGTYTVTESSESDEIDIDNLIGTTRKQCQPAAVMEQEFDYLDALRNATTFVIVGNALEFSDDGGAPMVRYVAVPEDATKLGADVKNVVNDDSSGLKTAALPFLPMVFTWLVAAAI